MAINEFTNGELITDTRMNEMVTQLNTRYYVVDQTVGRTVKVWDYLNQREQLIYGDTGERDITALLSPAPLSGKLILSRTNSSVQLELQDLVLQAGAASFVQYANVIGAGFRHQSTNLYFNTVSTGSSEDVSAVRISGSSGQVTVYGLKVNETQRGVFTWRTNDPWPTTLPGVAA